MLVLIKHFMKAYTLNCLWLILLRAMIKYVLRFSSNLELLEKSIENREKLFHRCYLHNIFKIFKSITQWCVTVKPYHHKLWEVQIKYRIIVITIIVINIYIVTFSEVTQSAIMFHGLQEFSFGPRDISYFWDWRHNFSWFKVVF